MCLLFMFGFWFKEHTPLHYAASKWHLSVVVELFTRGANIKGKDDEVNFTIRRCIVLSFSSYGLSSSRIVLLLRTLLY